MTHSTLPPAYPYQARSDFERGVVVFEHTGHAADLLISQYFAPVPAELRPIEWVNP